MERAVGRVVGHVRPDSGLLGVGRRLSVGLGLVGGGEEEAVLLRLPGSITATLEGQLAFGGERLEGRHRLGRHERDGGPFLDELLGLAPGNLAAPDDETGASAQVE